MLGSGPAGPIPPAFDYAQHRTAAGRPTDRQDTLLEPGTGRATTARGATAASPGEPPVRQTGCTGPVPEGKRRSRAAAARSALAKIANNLSVKPRARMFPQVSAGFRHQGRRAGCNLGYMSKSSRKRGRARPPRAHAAASDHPAARVAAPVRSAPARAEADLARAVELLRDLDARRLDALELRDRAVSQLRGAGVSWARLAEVTGTSRQALMKRSAGSL